MTDHDLQRKMRALVYKTLRVPGEPEDWEQLCSVVAGLQSTDDPSLVPLWEEMSDRLEKERRRLMGDAPLDAIDGKLRAAEDLFANLSPQRLLAEVRTLLDEIKHHRDVCCNDLKDSERLLRGARVALWWAGATLIMPVGLLIVKGWWLL
jgi:hypothetical protein